jgi:hypothetical protein
VSVELSHRDQFIFLSFSSAMEFFEQCFEAGASN